MDSPIGFDPTAVLMRDDGEEEHVGVTLWRRDDGRWQIAIEDDDEQCSQITLRADFLSEITARSERAA